jgi:hypothetical protein
MALFVIEMRHAAEEHDRAVAEVLRMAPEAQLVFLWSCRTGLHKAWAFVEADGRGEALELLPAFLRPRSTAQRVERYGAGDVSGVWDEAA